MSKKVESLGDSRPSEFQYIKSNDHYLDSACQSMRPGLVTSKLTEYYQNYNACGGRVKYFWGQKVDQLIEETRYDVLKYFKLNPRKYAVSFTLNTTYGINLLLTQLKAGLFENVVTSEIEHNSVFLPTLELSKRLGLKRMVLERDDDGSLIYENADLKNAVIVLNAVSNIDGRRLENINNIVETAHRNKSIVIIDAAQAASSPQIFEHVEPDAVVFSGHKVYSSSLGVVVFMKSLLSKLDTKIIGGGMVSQVDRESYSLLPDEPSAILEPGLQDFAGIIALKSALEWNSKFSYQHKNAQQYVDDLALDLYQGLSRINGIKILNNQARSVISFYSEKYDAHQLAIFLSAGGVMARSGAFCCHYYFKSRGLPPMLRFSIGLHNNSADIQAALNVIKNLH